MSLVDKKPERIEYQVRATGWGASRIDCYVVKENKRKGKTALEAAIDKKHELDNFAPRARCAPWVIEARYVGPWEDPEDAQLRKDVLDDNLERPPKGDE